MGSYSEILKIPGFNLIASGGVSSLRDIEELSGAGCEGTIVGKALYEGILNLKELDAYAEKENHSLSRYQGGENRKRGEFHGYQRCRDPVSLAKKYVEQRADELVFLDITATIEKRKIFTGLVTRIAEEINIPFTVGGGIDTVDDAAELIKAGADKVSVNTSAVRDHSIITELARQFGSQCIVVAIDTCFIDNDWIVYIDAGRTATYLKTIELGTES